MAIAALWLAGVISGCTVGGVPTGGWYQFPNKSLGSFHVLDTYGGGFPNEAFLERPCCSGSAWRISPSEDGYLLTNQAFGPERPLEVYPDGHALFLGERNGSAAQRWHITALADRWYRFTNALLGPGKSLDAHAEPPAPFMAPTSDVDTQKWGIRRR